MVTMYDGFHPSYIRQQSLEIASTLNVWQSIGIGFLDGRVNVMHNRSLCRSNLPLARGWVSQRDLLSL
jgi:hypothetical protein